MKITIETATNGWIITVPDFVVDEDNKETQVDDKIVVEDTHSLNDGSLEHNKAIRILLYEIMEQLGESGSKHNDYRTHVIIKSREGVIFDG